LTTIRHHSIVFLGTSTDLLNREQASILSILDRYELTIAEQDYMDKLDPSLNVAPFANASFSNLGATGMVRDREFKEIVSLAHQGRVFSDATIDLHRLNQTGKKLDLPTRAKMSANNAGVQVEVVCVGTGQRTTYRTKSRACTALGVSMRTLTR
jgi:hypothetical protein